MRRVEWSYFNGFGVFLASLIIPLALGACAGGAGHPGAQNGQTQIGLSFPDGYTYDNTTHALYPPSGKTSAVMPPYVTGMTLTITGEDMDTQVLQIDLSTLSVSFVISPGIRTFTITITTSIGLTFTDSITMEVVSGAPLNLNFNLNVNAAPRIDSATASPAVTEPGRVVGLACSATDLDPDDTLTYTWSGPGGFTVQGQTGSFTIPEYGVYEFTCTVDDGQGGRATATASVSAPPPNEPPFVTSIQVLDAYTMTVPTQYWIYQSVVVTCSSRDPEGDQVYTSISDQYGTVIGTGPTSGAYTLPLSICSMPFRLNDNAAFLGPSYPFTFKCAVNDKWHAPVVYHGTINVLCFQ